MNEEQEETQLEAPAPRRGVFSTLIINILFGWLIQIPAAFAVLIITLTIVSRSHSDVSDFRHIGKNYAIRFLAWLISCAFWGFWIAVYYLGWGFWNELPTTITDEPARTEYATPSNTTSTARTSSTTANSPNDIRVSSLDNSAIAFQDCIFIGVKGKALMGQGDITAMKTMPRLGKKNTEVPGIVYYKDEKGTIWIECESVFFATQGNTVYFSISLNADEPYKICRSSRYASSKLSSNTAHNVEQAAIINFTQQRGNVYEGTSTSVICTGGSRPEQERIGKVKFVRFSN